MTEENWYEVSFDGPHNVTGLRVQVPVNNISTHDPYLTEFSVFLEHASDELGSLRLFQHPRNDSVSYEREFVLIILINLINLLNPPPPDKKIAPPPCPRNELRFISLMVVRK